jgi:uncharacterized protein (TIGR02996 family)
LPWLVREQEATKNGQRTWHLDAAEREEGLRACDDAIEALEAIARLLPRGADMVPPDKITSAVGAAILRAEPRRFSALRLQTRRAVFVKVRESLERAQPRKPRDRNLDDLFAQILARPHDEDVRLVFADAIGASDPEYAEFVVTQIEARRLRRAGQQPTGVQRDRQAVLLEQYGDLWANGVHHHASRWAFRSGFVEHVELTTGALVKEAATLFQRAPIRHVTLVDDASGALPAALGVPQLEQLAVLSLVSERSLVLSGLPLPGLKVLDLRRVPGATRAVVKLSAPNLQHVVLAGDAPVELELF